MARIATKVGRLSSPLGVRARALERRSESEKVRELRGDAVMTCVRRRGWWGVHTRSVRVIAFTLLSQQREARGRLPICLGSLFVIANENLWAAVRMVRGGGLYSKLFELRDRETVVMKIDWSSKEKKFNVYGMYIKWINMFFYLKN